MHSTNARAFPFHVLTHTDEPCLLTYRHKKCTTPASLQNKTKCRVSLYIILQHFQNVPCTTTRCFAYLTQMNLPRLLVCISIIRTAPHYISRPNCTEHVKYLTPLFLFHKRYYSVSLYLQHLVVPLTQAIPPRLICTYRMSLFC